LEQQTAQHALLVPVQISNALEDANDHINQIQKRISQLIASNQIEDQVDNQLAITRTLNSNDSQRGNFTNDFLNRVCLPIAEEVGLLLQDKIRYWRANNTRRMVEKAEAILFQRNDRYGIKAHPRILSKILEESSWINDDELQSMWSGLLASSCTEGGNDESNHIFTDLLSRLSSSQANVLNFACENCNKGIRKGLLVVNDTLTLKSIEELVDISKIHDIHILDRELDHLRSLDLILDGLGWNEMVEELTISITPSALALQMYIRCQGYVVDPSMYFDVDSLDELNVSQEVPQNVDSNDKTL
jgi:hypothetical protein